MAIQKKEVEYAKEIDDVLVLVNAMVADIKAKKSITEISADGLPKLMDAISGIDGVSGELQSNRKVVLATIGSRTGELADALIS